MLKLKSNTWFISDPHYGHSNLVKGITKWEDSNITRDFQTLEEMNAKIVDNINSCVSSNDTLISLGDWSFSGPKNIKEFRDRLNCQNIIFIKGNHDDKHGTEINPFIDKATRAADLFTIYTQYLEVSYNKTPIMLFHFPIHSWNHMSKGGIHLHGHTHSSPENKFFNGGKSMDVGLDGNNLMPYHIDEIMNIMSARPIKREGHHV